MLTKSKQASILAGVILGIYHLFNVYKVVLVYLNGSHVAGFYWVYLIAVTAAIVTYLADLPISFKLGAFLVLTIHSIITFLNFFGPRSAFSVLPLDYVLIVFVFYALVNLLANISMVVSLAVLNKNKKLGAYLHFIPTALTFMAIVWMIVVVPLYSFLFYQVTSPGFAIDLLIARFLYFAFTLVSSFWAISLFKESQQNETIS